MNRAAQISWVISALLIASCGVVGWVVLQGYRWVRRSAQSSWRRAFEGLQIHQDRAPGLVVVVFHTYHGVFAFVEQTEHRFWASPDDAREALWRLHRFNLSWGTFARGGILIAPLSYGNYLTQKRSIRKQEEENLFKPFQNDANLG